jgi:hypothetical protein
VFAAAAGGADVGGVEGAGAPDGGAARGVEEAELDAAGVGDFAHDAAQRIDFADEVAFGYAADSGVAGHLGDEVEVEGEEGGAEAHARGGGGGFAACVAGADDEDVEGLGEARCAGAFGGVRNDGICGEFHLVRF